MCDVPRVSLSGCFVAMATARGVREVRGQMRCTARKHIALALGAVCFSERMSKPRAKARAVPRHCMAHDALAQRGPQQGESRSPLKTPRENIEPEECRAPPASAGEQQPRHIHGNNGNGSQRRSHCARCTRLRVPWVEAPARSVSTTVLDIFGGRYIRPFEAGTSDTRW